MMSEPSKLYSMGGPERGVERADGGGEERRGELNGKV
jgi:hypothetical protein